MNFYQVCSFVLSLLLIQTHYSHAMLDRVFPVFGLLFGSRAKRLKQRVVPSLEYIPDTLSAQASTVAQSEEQSGQRGQQVTSTTLMPHSVVHVPAAKSGAI